jgi:hypothetical protein
MAGINAVFGRPFKQQVAAFRLRLGNLAPTAKWTDIWQAEHDRAFMVAGAIKADVLADIAAMIDKAISQGTTLETFRKEFRAMVATKGWQISPAGQGTKGGEAWRTRLIYKTNLSVSYAAGRFAQLVEANHAYWIYFHGASLEPREQHLAWDGLILPPSHPFWATHAPPNGWGCSCYIIGAGSMAGAIRRGGKPDLKLPDNWQALDPRTGAPIGIDKGWAYAPGASVARTLETIADKVAAMPPMTGADLIAEWPDALFTAWSDRFQPFMTWSLAGRPEGRSMIVGAMQPDVVRAAIRAGVTPVSAEIAITDRVLLHIFRDAKASPVSAEWMAALPQHLRNPVRVLLDQTNPGAPSLLLIFDVPGAKNKLAVRVNYNLKRVGTLNVIRTATQITERDIASMLGRGILDIT